MNILELLLFLGLAVTATFGELDSYCPQNTIGSQCMCEKLDIGNQVQITCNNIHRTNEILDEIQQYRGYNIDLLVLEKIDLPYLPFGLFEGMSVKELVFSYSVLKKLYNSKSSGPNPFAGLENSLQDVGIYETKNLNDWYWPDFSNFTNLKTFTIVNSPINFVGHNFAEMGKGSLENISVSYSSVYRIHPQAFPELTNLKLVDFSGNYLPYMVRTMFPDPAPELRTINLSYNRLFTLPENMFDNMPVLEFVDLSRNLFKKFENMPVYSSLQFFYISNNRFKCDCSLRPLKDLMTVGSVYNNDFDRVECYEVRSGNSVYLKDISSDELKCYR